MAGAASFLDDLVKGVTQGLDSTKQIKASVNRVASNMTDAAKKAKRTQQIAKGLNLKPSMDKAVSTARALSGNPNIDNVPKIRLGGGVAGNLNRSKIKQVAGNTRNITVPGGNNSLARQAGDFLGGGLRETYQGVRGGAGVWDSFKAAHTTTDAAGNTAIDMKRAAGTFMAVSTAGRIATGGGLYKDRYGNSNLPGIPFL